MSETRSPVERAPVLLFTDALLRGGAERLLVELATRLDRARFAPAVACFRQEAFADELAAASCPVHILPKRRACDLALLLRLVRLIRRERFAIVHAHDLQSAAYGLLAAKAARRRSLLTVHGLGIFRQKRSARLLPRLARRLDAVVFVGEWLQRAAAEDSGVRPRRPRVIHNGVDVSVFSPGPPEPALRAEVGIEGGAPVVGSVGNLRPVKDYPCLLRAFALALRSLSPGERAGVRGSSQMGAHRVSSFKFPVSNSICPARTPPTASTSGTPPRPPRCST
jgi:glycosyltransferase involved in cell wall biosynthesis